MNNPVCPYCGAEMRVKNMYETVAFACSCGAMSPVKDTKEEALAAALRLDEQHKPLLKPLAFSDIAGTPVVFLEDYDKKDMIRALPMPFYHIHDELMADFLTVEQDTVAARQSDYNVHWRAWASEPTEYERSAALWEEYE